MKSNHTLHYTILAAVIILTLARTVLWNTPNNVLHEHGFGSAVATDLSLGVLFAFGLAIVSLFNRKKAPSKKVFYATQILAWLNSIGVWIILIGFGFYAVLNGGV